MRLTCTLQRSRCVFLLPLLALLAAPAARSFELLPGGVPPTGPSAAAWLVRHGAPDAAVASELGVILLHTGSWATPEMHKCLKLLAVNVAPTTPLRTYIFHREAPPAIVRAALAALPTLRPTLVPLADADWRLPAGAHLEKAAWTPHFTRFGEEYRAMGHWRLTFPFEFARHVGHRSILFIDHDSEVLAPPPGNLAADLSAEGIDLAYRTLVEDPMIGKGLPELAGYFIESNNLQPAQLYGECVPPNAEGLHTPRGDGTGWRARVPYGNFVVVSLDWWFRADVQRFLNLCLFTGDHIRHRWNEQQVIGMLRALFVPPERELRFNFSYKHGGAFM